MTKKLVVEGLEQAVIEYNNWKGNARIYFDTETDEAWTEVFINDVSAAQTFNNNHNVVCIFSKSERQGVVIGKKRKEMLLKVCSLLKEGWYMDQIEYNLGKEFYNLGM